MNEQCFWDFSKFKIEKFTGHSLRKEGHIMLFNNALNTFYIWLYHVEHMVTDHLDSTRRNPLPPLHSIPFPSSFTCTIQDKIAHTMHLLHQSWKEGNVLFNDALNTFYLRLYGVRHMVKDHSDSERGNPLPPHGLLFPISSKGSFICTIPDRIAHTMPLLYQSWSTGWNEK